MHRAAIAAIATIPVSTMVSSVVVLTPLMATWMTPLMTSEVSVTSLLVKGQDWPFIFHLKRTDHLALWLAPEIFFRRELNYRRDMIARDEGSLALQTVSHLTRYLCALEELHLLDYDYLRITEADGVRR